MSWQDYVNNNLVGSGYVRKAAIVGLDNSLWAKSADFNISVDEIRFITANIDNEAAFRASGVRVEEQKHIYLRTQEGAIYTKNKEVGGLCIAKCKQCILIGMYDTTMQPGACNDVVEKLADYLKNAGY